MPAGFSLRNGSWQLVSTFSFFQSYPCYADFRLVLRRTFHWFPKVTSIIAALSSVLLVTCAACCLRNSATAIKVTCCKTRHPVAVGSWPGCGKTSWQRSRHTPCAVACRRHTECACYRCRGCQKVLPRPSAGGSWSSLLRFSKLPPRQLFVVLTSFHRPNQSRVSRRIVYITTHHPSIGRSVLLCGPRVMSRAHLPSTCACSLCRTPWNTELEQRRPTP
jgi:hypothetical protein